MFIYSVMNKYDYLLGYYGDYLQIMFVHYSTFVLSPCFKTILSHSLILQSIQ